MRPDPIGDTMNNFLEKLSKREKIALFTGITLVIAAILDIVAVKPISGKIQFLDREIKVSEKQLCLNLCNIARKEVVEKEYKEYDKYVGEEGSEEEETSKILSEIETLARKSGMYLIKMKPQSPKVTGFQKEYKIEIEAEGKIEIVVQFLYQLNNSSQLLRAEKIRFTLKEENTSVFKVSMLISKILII